MNYLWIFGQLKDEATPLLESARHHPVTWHHITKEGKRLITTFKTNNLQSNEKPHNYYSSPNMFGSKESEKKG
jgi:hypothetical protein